MASRQVGDYEVLEKLGSGLQGKVYRVKHAPTGAVYAAKFINQLDLQSNAKNFQNLQKEVTALQRLDGHPNIVGIKHVSYDVLKPRKKRPGQFKKCVMLVLELAARGEMFDYLLLNKFEEPVARTYFKQLLEALNFAHGKGVIHRDLKPENILLDAQYALKVADWGLSALMEEMHGLLRTACGTKAYMPPEVLARSPYKGASADIWSAGVLLFIMLSGIPPFEAATPGDWWFDRVRLAQHEYFWAAHERTVAFSPAAKDLLNNIFQARPDSRLSIEDALAHPWFTAGPKVAPIASAEAAFADMHRRRKLILQGKGKTVSAEEETAMALVTSGTPLPIAMAAASARMAGLPLSAGGNALPPIHPAVGGAGVGGGAAGAMATYSSLSGSSTLSSGSGLMSDLSTSSCGGMSGLSTSLSSSAASSTGGSMSLNSSGGSQAAAGKSGSGLAAAAAAAGAMAMAASGLPAGAVAVASGSGGLFAGQAVFRSAPPSSPAAALAACSMVIPPLPSRMPLLSKAVAFLAPERAQAGASHSAASGAGAVPAAAPVVAASAVPEILPAHFPFGSKLTWLPLGSALSPVEAANATAAFLQSCGFKVESKGRAGTREEGVTAAGIKLRAGREGTGIEQLELELKFYIIQRQGLEGEGDNEMQLPEKAVALLDISKKVGNSMAFCSLFKALASSLGNAVVSAGAASEEAAGAAGAALLTEAEVAELESTVTDTMDIL